MRTQGILKHKFEYKGGTYTLILPGAKGYKGQPGLAGQAKKGVGSVWGAMQEAVGSGTQEDYSKMPGGGYIPSVGGLRL